MQAADSLLAGIGNKTVNEVSKKYENEFLVLHSHTKIFCGKEMFIFSENAIDRIIWS